MDIFVSSKSEQNIGVCRNTYGFKFRVYGYVLKNKECFLYEKTGYKEYESILPYTYNTHSYVQAYTTRV